MLHLLSLQVCGIHGYGEFCFDVVCLFCDIRLTNVSRHCSSFSSWERRITKWPSSMCITIRLCAACGGWSANGFLVCSCTHSQEWSAIPFSFNRSPEIYHTVWRTWHLIACSDKSWLNYQFSLHHLCISSRMVRRICIMSLGVKGLNNNTMTDKSNKSNMHA